VTAFFVSFINTVLENNLPFLKSAVEVGNLIPRDHKPKIRETLESSRTGVIHTFYPLLMHTRVSCRMPT
jgi:hypothetical protein